MKNKVRSPLVPAQPPIPVEPLATTSSDAPDAPVSLMIADEILLIKDEINNEAGQVLGKEVSKQQTTAIACEVIKKELAEKADMLSQDPHPTISTSSH